MFRNKVTISIIVFIFAIISGLVGSLIKHGEITYSQFLLLILFSLAFSLTIYFSMRAEWFIKNNEMEETKAFKKSYGYQSIKKIYAFSLILIMICGVLFILYKPNDIRFLEIIVPLAILISTLWYTFMIKKLSGGEIIANRIEKQIGDSFKRGALGGLILGAVIIILLFLYFFISHS